MRTLFLMVVLCCTGITGMTQDFPRSWEGKWNGEVAVWSSTGKQSSFPMSLEILPKDSVWTYTIFYGHGQLEQADIREYTLLVLDDSLGHYAVDEHNGILLDAYYMDDCLYSVFAGMGSQLQSRVCLEDDQLNYEISSFFEEPIRTSGDTIIDTDTIPPIQSFEVYSLMRAQLFRE